MFEGCDATADVRITFAISPPVAFSKFELAQWHSNDPEGMDFNPRTFRLEGRRTTSESVILYEVIDFNFDQPGNFDNLCFQL